MFSKLRNAHNIVKNMFVHCIVLLYSTSQYVIIQLKVHEYYGLIRNYYLTSETVKIDSIYR